jgi:hypothetical protein
LFSEGSIPKVALLRLRNGAPSGAGQPIQSSGFKLLHPLFGRSRCVHSLYELQKGVGLQPGAIQAVLRQLELAIGVKLPKKKAVKPPVLLTFPEIKLVIEHLQEPTKTIVILIVFASMRVGEALALRWNDILNDRIVIDERLYDDDLDDPKTLHGNREVPTAACCKFRASHGPSGS